jgi:hypothetical protein
MSNSTMATTANEMTPSATSPSAATTWAQHASRRAGTARASMLLSTLLPALLALASPARAQEQAPAGAPAGGEASHGCKAYGGQTACGHNCIVAYGRPHCAPLPGGQCVANGGKVACGFSCIARAGDVQCAQTPSGTCTDRLGVLQCFDPTSPGGAGPDAPAPVVVPPAGLESQVEKAACHAAGAQTVCGFHCVRTAGSVTCARTPNGACGVTMGRATCNDPPGQLGVDPRVPKMSCVENAGRMACGYGCATLRGEVRCAQTPRGSCQVVNGQFACFDPPVQ